MKHLETGTKRFSGPCQGTQFDHQVFVSEEGVRGAAKVAARLSVSMATSEDGARGLQPRDAGASGNRKRPENRASPGARRRVQPWPRLDSHRQTHVCPTGPGGNRFALLEATAFAVGDLLRQQQEVDTDRRTGAKRRGEWMDDQRDRRVEGWPQGSLRSSHLNEP